MRASSAAREASRFPLLARAIQKCCVCEGRISDGVRTIRSTNAAPSRLCGDAVRAHVWWANADDVRYFVKFAPSSVSFLSASCEFSRKSGLVIGLLHG